MSQPFCSRNSCLAVVCRTNYTILWTSCSQSQAFRGRLHGRESRQTTSLRTNNEFGSLKLFRPAPENSARTSEYRRYIAQRNLYYQHAYSNYSPYQRRSFYILNETDISHNNMLYSNETTQLTIAQLTQLLPHHIPLKKARSISKSSPSKQHFAQHGCRSSRGCWRGRNKPFITEINYIRASTRLSDI